MIDVYQPLRLTDILRMHYLLDNNSAKIIILPLRNLPVVFFFNSTKFCGYFASKPMSLPKIVHEGFSSAHVSNWTFFACGGRHQVTFYHLKATSFWHLFHTTLRPPCRCRKTNILKFELFIRKRFLFCQKICLTAGHASKNVLFITPYRLWVGRFLSAEGLSALATVELILVQDQCQRWRKKAGWGNNVLARLQKLYS